MEIVVLYISNKQTWIFMGETEKKPDQEDEKWLFFSYRNKIKVKKDNDSWICDGDKGHSQFKDKSEEVVIAKALEMGYKESKDFFERSLRSENLLLLVGAGSSVGSLIGTSSYAGGKTMPLLWDDVVQASAKFDDILNDANYSEDEGKDLERLLSRLQVQIQSEEIKGDAERVKKLREHVEGIEKIITEHCSFSLDEVEGLPHVDFLRNAIKARKKTDPRLKVFSLNYDLLFEQAADKINALIIDGFSFQQEKSFNGSNFDLDIVRRERSRIHNEENFYDKVFHLYKIHGSIDWEKSQGKVRRSNNQPEKPLLIYPNSSKYESSYQMPFFEMMARFQVELRKPNTCLMIIGYGFNDEHVNSVIRESIRMNVNLETVVVSRSIKANGEADGNLRNELFTSIEQGHRGITLIADSFLNFSNNLPQISFEDRGQMFYSEQPPKQ